MSPDPTNLRPIVIGANHRSSSLALRDALFVDDAAQPTFLAALQDAGLPQAVVLCTCDRVEVLAMHYDPQRAETAVTEAFARRAQLPAEALAGQVYTLIDDAAVRHSFAVAASLDSLVIGEPHVLGQVKACHRLARAAGTSGPELEALLAAAYGAAKRVRTETKVAERPVSIASAAVHLACDLHGELAECQAVLLGGGEMGELMAESLLAGGLRHMVVAAPRQSRAEAIAEALNCHIAHFGALAELLTQADIVLTAVGGRQAVIGPEDVQAALRKRRRKPIFLVDAGIPGDIDPAVNRVDGAYLYDLTDLERVALEGRASREAAAGQAWAIIDEELAGFSRERAARVAVPAIVALRARFEAIRGQVLAEAGGDAEQATRLLIKRLLHDPSEAMKELAGGVGWDEAERLLTRLFRLE
jgi:glutamyl-tRNA reductase